MYLTRFEINRARRDTRRLRSSLQSMHAAVLASFPADDTDGRVLWRTDDTGKALYLYISSTTKPDLTHLAEQIGWPTRPVWDTRDCLPMLNALAVGQRWGFRLTANPTHIGRMPDGSKRRFGHVTVTQQTQWLLDRTKRLGFRIAPTAAGDDDVLIANRITHTFNRQGATITLSIATFDGHLDITDPAPFREALVNGIGRSKAYGCGLMTLARP